MMSIDQCRRSEGFPNDIDLAIDAKSNFSGQKAKQASGSEITGVISKIKANEEIISRTKEFLGQAGA